MKKYNPPNHSQGVQKVSPDIYINKLSQNCFTIATKRGEIKQNDWTSIGEVKSLGIRLDPQLTMHKHIMYVKQYCIRQLKS